MLFLIAGLIVGGLIGFFTGKSLYQTTDSVKIERDTVVVNDTIRYYLPTPKDSIRTKYITRWLPVVTHDTTLQIVEKRDTVEVQVPITSKHYGAPEYDAWVSGYEPSLDSIKVYQKTEYINTTTTITKATRNKPWGLGFSVGYGYDIRTKTASPYVGVGVSYDIISF